MKKRKILVSILLLVGCSTLDSKNNSNKGKESYNVRKLNTALSLGIIQGMPTIALNMDSQA